MAGVLTACAPLPKGASQADTTRPTHHTDTGFRNLHIDDERKGFGSFLRWQWERRFGPRMHARMNARWRPPRAPRPIWPSA